MKNKNKALPKKKTTMKQKKYKLQSGIYLCAIESDESRKKLCIKAVVKEDTILIGKAAKEYAKDTIDLKVVIPSEALTKPKYRNGFVGIWSIKFNSGSNVNEGVKISFMEDKTPIQVFIHKNRKLNSISTQIQNGLDLDLYNTNKFILSIEKGNGTIEGIFCDKSDFTGKHNGKAIITNDETMTYKSYQFAQQDIVKIGNSYYYKYLQTSLLSTGYIKDYFVLNPFKLISNFMINDLKWSLANSQNPELAFNEVIKYIGEISFDSVVDYVSQTLKCGKALAQAYVDEFDKNLDTFLTADRVTDQIMISLILRSRELQEKYINIYESVYPNVEIITELRENKKLNDITAQVKEKEEEYNTIKKQIRIARDEEKQIKLRIEEDKNKLKEIENNNHLLFDNLKKDLNTLFEEYPVSLFQPEINYTSRPLIKGEKLQICEKTSQTFHDCIDVLSSSLSTNGIITESEGFAKLLYSLINVKSPILLAGPYGDVIANVISTSLFNATPSVIDCKCENVIDINLKDIKEYEVVLVKNVFNSTHKDLIIEKLNNTEGIIIYTTPFSEDLKIEPRGLLNYMFPVFTADLIDEKPANKYKGCIGMPILSQKKTFNKSLLNYYVNELDLSKYLLKRIFNLISYLQYMNIGSLTEFEYQYIKYPLSYILNREENLLEDIRNNKEVSDIYKKDWIRKIEGSL